MFDNRNLQHFEWSGGTDTTTFQSELFTLRGTIGHKYLVISSIAVGAVPDGINPAGPFAARVDGDFSGFGTEYTHDIEVRDGTSPDMYSCPMIFPITFAGVSGDMRFTIVPASGSVTARQGSIHAFRLTDTDFTNSNYLGAGSTSGSTSFVDVTGSSKTFTVDADGDYLIIACASVGKGELTANFDARLVVDGTGYSQQAMRANSTTKKFPYAAIKKLTLTAGSHTMSIQHKVTTTGDVTTSQASVMALRFDGFPNIQVIEDTADGSATTADTNWHSHTNMTDSYTLAAYEALVLSCSQYRRGLGSVDASAQTLYDGATIQESRNESVIANSESVHFSCLRINPTAGAHTVTQQIKNHGSGVSSAFLSDSVTAVIQTQGAPRLSVFGGKFFGGQLL